MNSKLREGYFCALCFFDWMCIELKEKEPFIKPMRSILVTGFSEKRKGLKEAISDTKQLRRDIPSELKKSWEDYFNLCLASKESFDTDNVIIEKPETLEHYCHLILKSIDIAGRDEPTLFQQANLIILNTDLKVLQK